MRLLTEGAETAYERLGDSPARLQQDEVLGSTSRCPMFSCNWLVTASAQTLAFITEDVRDKRHREQESDAMGFC